MKHIRMTIHRNKTCVLCVCLLHICIHFEYLLSIISSILQISFHCDIIPKSKNLVNIKRQKQRERERDTYSCQGQDKPKR